MVQTPEMFGLVLRKDRRPTLGCIIRLANALMQDFPKVSLVDIAQDEHLVAFCVGISYRDLEVESIGLRASGAVAGEDFVATLAGVGLVDPAQPPALVAH